MSGREGEMVGGRVAQAPLAELAHAIGSAGEAVSRLASALALGSDGPWRAAEARRAGSDLLGSLLALERAGVRLPLAELAELADRELSAERKRAEGR